jgi:hypothetical protein
VGAEFPLVEAYSRLAEAQCRGSLNLAESADGTILDASPYDA